MSQIPVHLLDCTSCCWAGMYMAACSFTTLPGHVHCSSAVSTFSTKRAAYSSMRHCFTHCAVQLLCKHKQAGPAQVHQPTSMLQCGSRTYAPSNQQRFSRATAVRSQQQGDDFAGDSVLRVSDVQVTVATSCRTGFTCWSLVVWASSQILQVPRLTTYTTCSLNTTVPCTSFTGIT